MMPTPLVKGVRWGPGGHPLKLSPGDAVQEVPVSKATVIRSKSLFFFWVKTQSFHGVVVATPPGNSGWFPRLGVYLVVGSSLIQDFV